MGDYRLENDAAPDGLLDGDRRVIGNFEVGPAGVGPMADATTGDFYPIPPVSQGPAIESTPVRSDVPL